MQNSKPIVIILVHGTQVLWRLERFRDWVRARLGRPVRPRGLWSEKEQPFGARLSEALAGSTVTVCDIPWSGANSHTARMKAVQRLRVELARQPGAARFVISHSHGGNIARAAALDDPCTADGLVCLSTPFFYARERPNIGAIGTRAVAANMLVFLSLMLAWMWLSKRLGLSDDLSSVVFSLGVMGVLTCLILLLRPWLRRLKECDEYCKQIESAEINCPVLLIHVAGDEAFRWLKLGEWLPAFTQHLVRVAEAVPAWWDRHKRLSRAAWYASFSFSIGLGLLAAVVSVYQDHVEGTLGPGLAGAWQAVKTGGMSVVGGVALPLMVLLVVYGVPAACLALLEVPSTLAKYMAFGVLTWRYEVTTESALIGQSVIRQLPHTPQGRGLWHSQSYLHPETIPTIARWIRERLDERQATGDAATETCRPSQASTF